MQIDVHEAKIHTATIEVQTLALKGRQVTLSVFRQLLQSPYLLDGCAQGEAWGTVNYHPDKCADSKEHLHIVWDNAKTLFRDSVPIQFIDPDFQRTQRLIQGAMLKSIYEGESFSTDNEVVWVREHVVILTADLRMQVHMHEQNEISPDNYGRFKHAGRIWSLPKANADEMWARVESREETLLVREKRHDERIAELRNLPQLFIAI